MTQQMDPIDRVGAWADPAAPPPPEAGAGRDAPAHPADRGHAVRGRGAGRTSVAGRGGRGPRRPVRVVHRAGRERVGSMTPDDRSTAVRAALAGAGSGRASLLMVTDHRTSRPRVFAAPVDLAFAEQLVELATEVSTDAAEAEWRPAAPGFTPAAGQWLWTATAHTPLAGLDEEICRPTHAPYQRSVRFGRSNLMVLRIRADDGTDLLRLYQGFSPDKALGTGRRLVGFWSGERFTALTAPLVIDRAFRVVVAQGMALMPTAAAYEGLFGPPTAVRVEAAATFADAFEDALLVRGVDELRVACLSDLNMMRKLLSIRRRLDDPRFRAALTMDRVLAFLATNPQVTVPVDRSGPSPALVFEPGPQQRWALLKLLDDDYLRSDLTGYRYEANSKSDVR